MASNLVPILSLIISVAALIGGFVAYRSGYSKQASEIQQRVINALQAQNEAQEAQIETCEKELSRLKKVVTTIQYALKRRGLRIEINNDAITLIDEAVPRQEHMVQIQITDAPDDEKDKKKAKAASPDDIEA